MDFTRLLSEPLLARLLRLNHERYAEEVKQGGLHEPGRKGKGKTSRAKPAASAQPTASSAWRPRLTSRADQVAQRGSEPDVRGCAW